MQFRSVAQFERYLLQRDRKRADSYTLERMVTAMERLNHPELKYKVIHIGGTSGKGSTSHMITAILQAAGHTVGLSTSPAFTQTLDRISLNDRIISDKTFVGLLNQVWSKLSDLELTYFEWFTVIALLYFAKRRVDYAVIEVGVGGRLDATNVVTPTVAIVTDIGLDHTELLGRTRNIIAREKEAIIKPGCIGLTGSRYVKRARYINLDQATIEQESLQGTTFSYKHWRHVSLSLLGSFQVRNAILALETATALHLPKSAAINGLAQVRYPGRFEVISKQPLMIIDGAHNPQKMSAFITSLQGLITLSDYQRVVVLLSLKYNKAALSTLRPLIKIADEVIITSFSDSAPLPKLKQAVLQLKPSIRVNVIPQQAKALRAWRHQVNPSDLGLITGSLYLLGDLYPRL